MCSLVWTSKTRISNKISPRVQASGIFPNPEIEKTNKQQNISTHVLGVQSSSRISKQGQTYKKIEECLARFPPDPLRDWTSHQGKWRNTANGWLDLSKVSFFFGKQRRVGEAIRVKRKQTGRDEQRGSSWSKAAGRLRRWAPDPSVHPSRS